MKTEQVNIKTSDGIADAALFHPNGSGSVPGVIVLTDIFGSRPAFDDLSARIAERGYAVLTPNIFYRTGKPPFFDFPLDLEHQPTLDRMKEIRTPLTVDAMMRDGSAYVDFLATQSFVSDGPMGVVGFCLTGKDAFRLAAERSDRIGAAASYHGGGLYTDDENSPHLVLSQIKAHLYFGHAENDRSMPAEAIAKLDESLQNWGGAFESETYPAGHGWMIPGRPVYDAAQAQRGFDKLMDLFRRSLGSPVGV